MIRNGAWNRSERQLGWHADVLEWKVATAGGADGGIDRKKAEMLGSRVIRIAEMGSCCCITGGRNGSRESWKTRMEGCQLVRSEGRDAVGTLAAMRKVGTRWQ